MVTFSPNAAFFFDIFILPFSYVLFAEAIPYFAELPPPLLLGFDVGIGVGVGSSDSIPVT